MEASLTAVWQTLTYADIFDYPLTRAETEQWLIGKKGKVEAVLRDLAKRKLIGEKDGYFFLKGREEVVAKRKEKEKWAKEKWKIAQKTADKLARLPMVRLVGVTGALAMNNGQKEDDIDLLIVTSTNSLWLTRLLIFLFAPLWGIKRRKPGEKAIRNKICFNLFLEEGSLKVGPPSLFLAHEVAQLKPLFNKNQVYERFLLANAWAESYLPNSVTFNNGTMKQLNNGFMVSLLYCFIATLNWLAFQCQLLYMKPRMTIEKVSLHQAFFHPVNLQNKILGEYRQRLSS